MRKVGFLHVLETLAPRLDSVVIAGGWAWYLYRTYLTGARALPSEFTVDIDIVTPRDLSGKPVGLGELLDAGGFESRPEGDERPPVTHNFWPSRDAPEAELEFLTPARGSGEEATLEVAGVVAQQLRYLDLLLDAPLPLDINEKAAERRFVGRVLVPKVGRFVWQKALSFPRRRQRAKKDKDLLYVFDLAESSKNLLPRIREDIESYESRASRPWRRSAAENLQRECGDLESPGIGSVLRQIPEEQRPPRRYIHGTFQELAAILRTG